MKFSKPTEALAADHRILVVALRGLPMNIDTPIWNELLLYMDQGLVIPIVGQDLLVVEHDGRSVPAYQLLAERLAECLHIPKGELPPNFTLSQVVGAYPRFREKRSLVYAQIKSIYDHLQLSIPEPLRLLARISAFRIFLTTTFDTWLEKALQEERPAGAHRVPVVSYSPGTPPPDLLAEHLDSNLPVVFQLFGRISPAPQYAATDEDMLEYLYHLQANPPRNLCEAIRAHHLLLIGNAFSDWLARFFVRAARGERLLAQRGKEVFIVDNELQRSATLVSFLNGFCWETSIFPETAPAEFVRLLHDEWMARHPEAGLERAPPSPEEPSRASHLVFISYAAQDLEPATKLAHALSQVGINVWLDKQGGLDAGDLYRQKIKRLIWSCTLFMPVLSCTADRRDEGFFREEWAEALSRLPRFKGASRPFVIPVVVDDLDIYGSSNLPDEFRDVHITMAPAGVLDGEAVGRVQRLVRTIVKAERAMP